MYMPIFNMGFGFGGGYYSPCCCCCNPFGLSPFVTNPFFTNMVIYNPFMMTNLCSVPSFNNYNFQASYNYQTPDVSAFIPKIDFSQYTAVSTPTYNFSTDGFYDNLVSTISKNMLGLQTYQANSTSISGNIKTEKKYPSNTVSNTSNLCVTNDKTISKSSLNTSQTTYNKRWDEMTDEELKSVYGNYTRDITNKYTGDAKKLNKYIKNKVGSKKSVLIGQGQAFIDAQEKYGISASVLLAICMHESDGGKSNLAKTKNNVGGVRKKGSKEFETFSSVQKCIDRIGEFLKKGYVNNSTRSLTKLYEINARYCPASDTTDKKNENSSWAKAIERYASEIEKVDIIA